MNLSKDDIRPLITKFSEHYNILIGITDPPSYLSFFNAQKQRVLPELNYVITENTKEDLLINTIATINTLNKKIPETTEPEVKNTLREVMNFSCNFTIGMFFQQIPADLRFNAPEGRLNTLELSTEDREYLQKYINVLKDNINLTPHLPDFVLKQIFHIEEYFEQLPTIKSTNEVIDKMKRTIISINNQNYVPSTKNSPKNKI